jgi:predicted nucleotidyltransferase
VYKEHPFFIRYLRTGVKNNHSRYMAFPLRHARIRAVVLDDSESHYTPARYILDEALIVPLEIRLGRIEVLAYRSRFAEQASIHDEVVGEGMLESVWNIEGGRNLRLLLGSSQNDFIWRARLLTKRGMQTKNED